MTPTRLLAGLALALCATTASAQATTVYRCGNEYTHTPCSSGRAVDTGDVAVGSARRAEARRVAADERKLADEMAADRRRAEAAIKPALAGSLGPSRLASADPKAAAAKAKGSAKKAKRGGKAGDDGGDFVAAVPKAKAKA